MLETDNTYRVQKMAFAKQGKDVDKSVIRYNSQITTDKDSGIRNDPNDWGDWIDNPRYILDLVKRIVRA